MTYLKQHAQALRWEHKLDFRAPKEKEKEQDKQKNKDDDQSQKRKTKSEHKYDRTSSKSKRTKMTDKRSPNPKCNKTGDHCRRQQCRDRGTHTNHSHDDCKFKESDTNKKVSFKGSDNKHPNLGKAPAKKQRNTKTNASRPEKHASGNSHPQIMGRRFMPNLSGRALV
jgi:hypothetical protein